MQETPMTQRYQGDVLVLTLNETTTPHMASSSRRFGLSRREICPAGKWVLFLGEATGHSHDLVPSPEAEGWMIATGEGFHLVIKSGSAQVTHPEHAPIALDPGCYFIGQQVEYESSLVSLQRGQID
jgi:hypothetical protein